MRALISDLCRLNGAQSTHSYYLCSLSTEATANETNSQGRRLHLKRMKRMRVGVVSRCFFIPRDQLVFCSVQKIAFSFWFEVVKILVSSLRNGSLLARTFHHTTGIKENCSFLEKPASVRQKVLQTTKRFLFFRNQHFSPIISLTSFSHLRNFFKQNATKWMPPAAQETRAQSRVDP